MPAETHKCIHEVDWGMIHKTLETMEENQRTVLRILQGNGKEGLVTKAALNSQSIRRAWWWLGGISTALLISGGSMWVYILKVGR